MKNPFKKAVKNLMKDFEDYNYLLGDLETYEFYKNNSIIYINDIVFKEHFPVTHKFLLLESIIGYVGIIEGSAYIGDFEVWKQNFDNHIEKYLQNTENAKDIMYFLLKGHRDECYRKYTNNIIDPSWPLELVYAGNALIPIMKYLYSISDEFK